MTKITEEELIDRYAGLNIFHMFEMCYELETRNTALEKENMELRKERYDFLQQIEKQKKDHQDSINWYNNKCDQYEADEQYSRDMYKDQDLGPVWG